MKESDACAVDFLHSSEHRISSGVNVANPTPTTEYKKKIYLKSIKPTRQELAEALVSDTGVDGSFSVGCLPKHLAQPKGNTLFPGEVVLASFVYLFE